MTNSLPHPDSGSAFEERLEILSKELELSGKWRRPAILVALYGSEDVRAESTTALEQYLLMKHNEEVVHLHLDKESEKRIVTFLHKSQNTENRVCFLDGFKYFNGEDKDLLKFLGEFMDLINEKKLRAILWLTQDEAVNLAHQAPDFWISCQRIVEFETSLNQEHAIQYALDLAWQGVRDGAGLLENEQSRLCLQDNWLADLTQDYPSAIARANLFLALGILNWRQGDYENSNYILRNALNLSIRLQNNQLEAECYNAMALVKSSLGQHEEAIEAYRQAIHLVPDQVSTWNHMGNLCLKIRRNDEAIIAFQKTIEHHPEDPIAWNGLGNVYFQIGYMKEAIHAYQNAIAFEPSLPQPWNGLGNIHTAMGKWDEAIHAYRKSIQLNQQSITPWLGLAHLFVRQDRNRDAIKAYQQALGIDAKNSSTWDELGQIYLKLGDHQEAARSFSNAIQLDPGFVSAHRNLALTYFRMGQHSEAISLYTRSIEQSVDKEEKAKSWNCMGDAYRQLGEYDHAMAAYQMADQLASERFADSHQVPEGRSHPPPVEKQSETEMMPTRTEETCPAPVEEKSAQQGPPDPLQLPSWVFPNEKRMETNAFASSGPRAVEAAPPSRNEASQIPAGDQSLNSERGETGVRIALPKFNELQPDLGRGTPIKTDSTVSKIWNEKGNACLQSGDYEGAIRAYNQAIELDASFGQPYNNLALVYLQLGRLEEALLYSLKGLELAGTDQEKAASWNEVGLIYRCRRDYHNALAAFQKADELDPDSVRFNETVEYPRAHSIPQNAQVWQELGNMFFKTGAYPEAAKAYRQAVAMDPVSGACLSDLALCLVFQGQYREAAHYYQKSIPLFQEDKDKAVVWDRLGDVYRRLNDHDNAISAYQTAIKLTKEPVNLLTRARFSLLSNCRVQ